MTGTVRMLVRLKSLRMNLNLNESDAKQFTYV